jgi:hypothetical protein
LCYATLLLDFQYDFKYKIVSQLLFAFAEISEFA